MKDIKKNSTKNFEFLKLKENLFRRIPLFITSVRFVMMSVFFFFPWND